MQHTHYTICVLTNLANGQSMRDLTRVAKTHNIVFDQITYPIIPLSTLTHSELLARIASYDVVYYRTGMRGAPIAALTRVLDQRGIPVVNGVHRHPFTYQKAQQALIADQCDIAQPHTISAGTADYELITRELGETFVVKPNDGAHGTDVQLISNQAELDTYRAHTRKNSFVYQTYIEGAAEYRVYTVGGTAVATYKKIPGGTDFRSNLHTGGSMEATEREREERLRSFGARIAQCFDAEIAGIDILYKNGELLFLELNTQPGWEHLDEVTSTNFTQLTLQYLLDRAHAAQPWWKRMRS